MLNKTLHFLPEPFSKDYEHTRTSSHLQMMRHVRRLGSEPRPLHGHQIFNRFILLHRENHLSLSLISLPFKKKKKGHNEASKITQMMDLYLSVTLACCPTKPAQHPGPALGFEQCLPPPLIPSQLSLPQFPQFLTPSWTTAFCAPHPRSVCSTLPS